MPKQTDNTLNISPLLKVIMESFAAFLLSSFCLAYVLSMGVSSHLALSIFSGVLYIVVLGLIIYHLAKKLPLAALMLMIPIIPLAALLTVLGLLPLLEKLH